MATAPSNRTRPPESARRRKALLTGVTGQDGTYLAEFLLARGYEVWGLVRDLSLAQQGRIGPMLDEHSVEASRFSLVSGELTDSRLLVEVLQQVQPDEIYHLGAQSQVQRSFEDPETTGNVTGLGAVRLLEAIRQLKLSTRFFCASSSEIFGSAAGPLNEDSPIHPRNPYGAAKVYAHQMTRIYREQHGLFACNGILFNHESPLRGEMFVSRKITLALARILAGEQQQLTLGNLNAHRDWGYAGDYVAAMWKMLQAASPQDYVLSTGETHSVREFCSAAFTLAGLPLTWHGEGLDEVGVSDNGRELVKVDARYFRPEAGLKIFGDSSRAQQDLDWSPSVDFMDLVRMMVNHDLTRQRAEAQENSQ